MTLEQPWGVWLSRPRGTNEPLASRLRAQGFRVVEAPLLSIEPTTFLPELTNYLASSTLRGIICTSPQCIRLTSNVLRQQLMPHWLWYVMGPSSAELLECAGVSAAQINYPEGGGGSEALLALDSFRELSGERVLLLTGEGGRQIIQAGLVELSIPYDELILYQRKPATVAMSPLLEMFKKNELRTTLITSGEALTSLVSQISAEDESYWRGLPMVVLSARIKDMAVSMGFESEQIHVCDPNVDDMEAALVSLRERGG